VSTEPHPPPPMARVWRLIIELLLHSGRIGVEGIEVPLVSLQW
jgi:hypothetical protein